MLNGVEDVDVAVSDRQWRAQLVAEQGLEAARHAPSLPDWDDSEAIGERLAQLLECLGGTTLDGCVSESGCSSVRLSE